jgi:hypothetical protein
MSDHDRNNQYDGNNLVLFPSQFRVRCPRCGSAPKMSSFEDSQVRYSCRSGDDFQSEICAQWEKEGVAENLVSEARDILKRFQFNAPSTLRAVK